MAAPITHIILALQILPLLPSHFDKEHFLIGTSFPDIRYIAKLERDKTHIEPISWNSVITAPSAFRAGMIFHNLVDILRIKHFEKYFFDRKNIESYPFDIKQLYPYAMKNAEDYFLYHCSDQWSYISTLFDSILPEELQICEDESIVKKWHEFLQNYFQQYPCPKSIEEMYVYGGVLNESQIHKIINYFEKLLDNIHFQNHIESFKKNFVTHLNNELLVTPGPYGNK